MKKHKYDPYRHGGVHRHEASEIDLELLQNVLNGLELLLDAGR